MQTHYTRVSRLLVTAILLGPFTFAGAGAPGSFDVNGSDLLNIPLRWCAVEGSPAVTNPPGGASPANTSTVLLGRMINATNNTWLQASINFKSAVPAGIVVNFPIIADPKPPLAGGTGSQLSQLGDIDKCTGGTAATCELTAALAACRTAWNNLGMAQVPPITFRGPVVLNVRKLVNSSGQPSATGTSNWSLWQATSPTSPPGTPLRVCDSNWIVKDGNHNDGAYAVAWDKTLFTDAADRDRNLAHELGHVLFLAHGNGIDDESPTDGFVDACDGGWSQASASSTTVSHLNPSPLKETLTTPASLMTSGANTLPVLITADQKKLARTVGIEIDGAQYDPPAVLINGDVVGATQVDAAGDVADASADLVAAGITKNAVDQTTSIAFGLAGPVPHIGHYQYVALIDLDNNPATGGPPPALGFPESKSFTGADLVVSVAVIDGTASLRVWGFRAGKFRPIHDPRFSVELTESGGVEEDESEATDVQLNGLALQIPDDVLGSMAPTVHFRAYARHTAHHQVDALPDKAGGAPLSLTPPLFARAGVTPPEAQLCDPLEVPPCLDPEVTVEAADLLPHGLAQVFLGSVMVGEGIVDGDGNLQLVFTVPADTTPGPRLVSVRVGTVTAEVALEVLPPD